jgi:Tfp pilus assembly PilM family ATPase
MSALANILSLKHAPLPATALEVAANRVTAATIETRAGRPVISAHAAELLPAGALVPSLTTTNVRDKATVEATVGRVLDRLGRPRRVGLIVPDPVAKVSLLRFAQVPARSQDLAQLIRWQARKAAPFAIEEAQVSFVRGTETAEGQEFIVTLARRDLVLEYEDLCMANGSNAGVLDISTFNVINAVLAGGPSAGEDWLVVNVGADYASIAILRGGQLTFFRSRGADSEVSLTDVVHQTAMYYEDRLQGAGFNRILLSGAYAAGAGDEIARSLEARLGMAVEPVDPLAAARPSDRISVSATLRDTLAPLVGLLLRGREAA